jgi:serine-type D-Ala-D-Ala carboxypeptidase/endopeptidase (penicillin-binding protein 4)
MTMNIRKKRSPGPWPIFRRSKYLSIIRSPFLPARQCKVTGIHPAVILRTLLVFFLLILQLIYVLQIQGYAAEDTGQSIRQHIQNGGYAVKTAQGQIEGINSDTLFIPASTIKLITCLAALDILGPDYQFATRFHIDKNENLYIKGEGDPTITSEAVAAITKNLFDYGLRRVNALILDGSTFALETMVDGSENTARPYDAEITPLAVNFNALPLRVRADHTIGSGEEQTPVLPIMQEIGKSMAPGQYRLNVGAFPVTGNLPNEARYAGELFISLLRQQGIQTGNTILAGTIPKNAPLLFIHKSDTVRGIIRDCLEFSNNFIANELFVACGRIHFGKPATWEKGRKALAEFTNRTLHLPPETITMVEGSGLSRNNLISPRTMITVLEAFAPFTDLLPVRHDYLMKSGTLKGVYCYSGYLGDHDRPVPFTIMLNQETNSRDQILHLLVSQFISPAPAEEQNR